MIKDSKFRFISEDFIFIDQPKISINKSEIINSINNLIKLERSHKGLVQRDITFTRDGKKVTQKRWVKAGEDEPVERKGKKEEVEVKIETSLGSFSVGNELSMMAKVVTIEQVNKKEKTIKMSDGKVYTLAAVKKFSKPLAESKYKEGDKIIFDGEEKIVKRINRALEVIELDDGKMHTFDDMETFGKEPEKKKTIKDLKPVEKKPKVEKPEKPEKEEIEKFDGIVGSAKDGSLSAKERKLATENMEKFIGELREKEGKDIDNDDRVSKAGNYYTKGGAIDFNRYLVSDKKKIFDFETYDMKDATINDKKELDKRMDILDEFLDKAPKVKGTSYRAMWWDPNNPAQKKEFDSFMSNLKIGGIVESKPYSSTTTSKSIMKSFTDMAKSDDIVVRAEYEANGVYLGNESKEPEQLEVLIGRGIKFEVVSIKPNKKGDVIDIKFKEVELND